MGVAHQAKAQMHEYVAGYAVPLSDPDGGKGTGFFGRTAGHLSFYTAGHNLGPCVQQRFLRHDDWQWVNSSLTLHFTDRDGSGSICEVPLHADERPSFSWVPAGSEIVWDSIALGSRELAETFETVSAHFKVVDMDAAAQELAAGAKLICVGFPPSEGRGVWPYFPPAQVSGRYTGRHQRHMQADFFPAKGLSGGPVFTADGRLAGMITGSDGIMASGGWSRHARIVPARVLTGITPAG